MRKTAILIAGAIAFDLGVLVVASHAGDDLSATVKYKAAKIAEAAPQSDFFLKFDTVNTPQSCMTRGGKTASQNGVQGCLLPGKDGPASISDQGSGGVITSYKH